MTTRELMTREGIPGEKCCRNCWHWPGPNIPRCLNRRYVLENGVCLGFEEYSKVDEDAVEFLELIEASINQCYKNARKIMEGEEWRRRYEEKTE